MGRDAWRGVAAAASGWSRRGCGCRAGSWRGRLASRILCAAALADGCGDEPALIAAYGTEVGKLVRRAHADDRRSSRGRGRCRSTSGAAGQTSCGDGSERRARPPHRRAAAGDRLRPRGRLPAGEAEDAEAEGADCSGAAGRQPLPPVLDSTTPTRRPCAASRSPASEGYHDDDWEAVQIRIGPDGRVDERASSHHGYNYARRRRQLGLGRRHRPARRTSPRRSAPATANGWGPETGLLLVSGGSHAGNAAGIPHVDRFTPGRRVHLIPLEPIAAAEQPATASRSARPGASRSGATPRPTADEPEP